MPQCCTPIMSPCSFIFFLQCKAHFHRAEVSNKVFHYIAVKTVLKDTAFQLFFLIEAAGTRDQFKSLCTSVPEKSHSLWE